MSAAIAEPEVPVTRCKIDEVFASPFIELIALAPRNPVVRGLILAQTGKMPEPERQTFEQIKEWVETTCDPRAGGGHQTKAARLTETGIVIKVEFSETEYERLGVVAIAQRPLDRIALLQVADGESALDLLGDAVHAVFHCYLFHLFSFLFG
jgi:hypothetical protein